MKPTAGEEVRKGSKGRQRERTKQIDDPGNRRCSSPEVMQTDGTKSNINDPTEPRFKDSARRGTNSRTVRMAGGGGSDAHPTPSGYSSAVDAPFFFLSILGGVGGGGGGLGGVFDKRVCSASIRK